MDEPDAIRWAMDRQQFETQRLGLEPISLWGRPLQLIDCQNLFCEVDKYACVRHPEAQGRTGRMRIKQRFIPSTEPLTPWYPPKWGINDRIKSFLQQQQTILRVLFALSMVPSSSANGLRC